MDYEVHLEPIFGYDGTERLYVASERSLEGESNGTLSEIPFEPRQEHAVRCGG